MTRQKATKSTSLDLSGSLTVKNAAGLKDDLLKAFKRGTTIKINLEEVREVDLSSLQVLCAAHRFAIDKGKTIDLNDPAGILVEAGRVAGFPNGKECRFAKDNDCIWKEGRQ